MPVVRATLHIHEGLLVLPMPFYDVFGDADEGMCDVPGTDVQHLVHFQGFFEHVY